MPFHLIKNFVKHLDDANVQVSLFVVAKEPIGIKKVDFNRINAQKLSQRTTDQRFVTVIETNQALYAYANQKFVQLIENQKGLVAKGTPVSINSLSDSDSQRLKEVFEEYLQQENSGTSPINLETSQEKIQKQLREHYAYRHLLSDQISMNFLIAKMANIPDKIVLLCLQKISEHYQEQALLSRKEARQFEIKKENIKQENLKYIHSCIILLVNEKSV